jgi:diguanylate cyclase (GGDEF)-like protein/PAS domain S-box-containing protein
MGRIRTDKPDPIQSILQSTYDGIYQIKLDGIVTTWNKSAERMTGIPAEQVVGTNCQNNAIHHLRENGREYYGFDLPIIATMVDGASREYHAFLVHSDGYRVSVLIRTVPLFDQRGKVIGAAEVFNENKTLIAAFLRARQVEHTVIFDELTRIGSRVHIENKIKIALTDFKGTGISFGLLFVDIDRFKEFNDNHGHLTGDKVLKFVANVIKSHLRVSDSCGRWGGDEFLVIVLDIRSESLRIVADKLRQVIEQTSIKIDGRTLNVTISIGACISQAGDTLESLIQRADNLMYSSKQQGGNRVSFS